MSLNLIGYNSSRFYKHELNVFTTDYQSHVDNQVLNIIYIDEHTESNKDTIIYAHPYSD